MASESTPFCRVVMCRILGEDDMNNHSIRYAKCYAIFVCVTLTQHVIGYFEKLVRLVSSVDSVYG